MNITKEEMDKLCQQDDKRYNYEPNQMYEAQQFQQRERDRLQARQRAFYNGPAWQQSDNRFEQANVILLPGETVGDAIEAMEEWRKQKALEEHMKIW